MQIFERSRCSTMPDQIRHLTPTTPSEDTSSGGATFSPSAAEKGIKAERVGAGIATLVRKRISPSARFISKQPSASSKLIRVSSSIAAGRRGGNALFGMKELTANWNSSTDVQREV